MSFGPIHEGKHVHLWTKTIDGAEFANTIYENEIDAALSFCAIVQDIRKYSKDDYKITIEDVMGSLNDGRGMYAGVPGFILVLSRCDGGCFSALWN